MRQFERVQRGSRLCGYRAACVLAAAVAACVLAAAVAACVPEGVPRRGTDVGRFLTDTSINDAGSPAAEERDACLMLDGAPVLPDDVLMERPDFTVESDTDRIEVHAGGRAVLPLRLVRTGGHRAWIELRVSGLPVNVSGFFAMSPEADQVALVIEASDQAALVTLQPFTLEANGDGLRRTRRMALTVLPEAVEE